MDDRMHTVARVIGGLIGVGLLTVAGRFLLDPAGAAAGFGVPAPADDPYLAVKGVRDLGCALLLIALAVLPAPRFSRPLGVVLLVASVIPFGDALVVLTHDGPLGVVLGVHTATAVVAVAAGAVLVSPARERVAVPS